MPSLAQAVQDPPWYTRHMKPSLERILELQRLLAAFNQVDRMVHRKHADDYRAENDTEHSYNLAITAWFIAQYFPELDLQKVLTYSLAHDLVETYAGDTYAFAAAEELDTKEEREQAAIQRFKDEWSDFSELTNAMTAYQHRVDNESRFVYALDKVMPVMLVYIHEGYSWKKNHVTTGMIHDYKIDKVALSKEIAPYFQELCELLLAHPELITKE